MVDTNDTLANLLETMRGEHVSIPNETCPDIELKVCFEDGGIRLQASMLGDDLADTLGKHSGDLKEEDALLYQEVAETEIEAYEDVIDYVNISVNESGVIYLSANYTGDMSLTFAEFIDHSEENNPGVGAGILACLHNGFVA